MRAELWLVKQLESIYFLFIPFVACLLIRFLPLSLILIFLSLSSLRLCLLISSKSDASRYSSSCMISKARPYLKEKKKDDTFILWKVYKILKIFHFSWAWFKFKIKWKEFFFQIFVAFSEYMNFYITWSWMLFSNWNFGEVLVGIFEEFRCHLQNSNQTSLTLVGMR